MSASRAQEVGTSTGVQAHVCDVAGCEKGFATMREVVEHERTHRRESYVGRRVRLVHKVTRVETTGVIVADPQRGETRFRADGGEVGAYEWFWTLDA